MAKGYSVNQVLNRNELRFPFTGEWFDAFGTPGKKGVWFIWGDTGSGKTRFVLQLAKYICPFGKVIYNSLEEEFGVSLQNSFVECQMKEVSRKVIVVHESIEELSERLSKKNSPKIAIIDSFQYSGLNYKSYLAFKKKHNNKLIIFVSHADGKRPSGRSAKSVQYDAALKILVEGFVAYSQGRFIGPTGKYTIWEKGATEYWGQKTRRKNENIR